LSGKDMWSWPWAVTVFGALVVVVVGVVVVAVAAAEAAASEGAAVEGCCCCCCCCCSTGVGWKVVGQGESGEVSMAAACWASFCCRAAAC
jgi:hypothetical protein